MIMLSSYKDRKISNILEGLENKRVEIDESFNGKRGYKNKLVVLAKSNYSKGITLDSVYNDLKKLRIKGNFDIILNKNYFNIDGVTIDANVYIENKKDLDVKDLKHLDDFIEDVKKIKGVYFASLDKNDLGTLAKALQSDLPPGFKNFSL